MGKSSLAALSIAVVLGQGALAQFLYAGCDVSSAGLKLPPGQTTLQAPNLTPNSIALGVGFQNYTCSSFGNYTSAGAIAEFYDISCLLQASETAFDEVQNIAFSIWNGSQQATFSTLSELDVFITDTWSLDIHLGTHFFQPNPSGSGISPVFDYRAASRSQDADAFVLAAPKGNLPAPTGPQDVAWLELTQVQGDLGKEVFRVNTVAGQPPSSCTPGSDPISVKYAAQYWFFGGPPSPIVAEFQSIEIDVWDKINSGYYKDSSSYTGNGAGSSKSSVNAISNDNSGNSVLSLNSRSSAFPVTIALIVINGVLAVGVLVGVVVFIRTSGGKKSPQYVAAGAQNAPKGALEDIETEMGPFDPKDSLPILKKY